MPEWFQDVLPVLTLFLGSLLTWAVQRSNEQFRFQAEREREEVRQEWQLRYDLWRKKHDDYRAARKLVAGIGPLVVASGMDRAAAVHGRLFTMHARASRRDAREGLVRGSRRSARVRRLPLGTAAR